MSKQKIFHWSSTFKTIGEDDDGSVNIKGYASTNASDRAGDSIDHEAWTKNGGLENFKGNPIILFNHDYNRPIGRATSLEVNDKGLELGARISKSAGEVKDLIKDGVLGAFSVGFRVKDADYLKETDGYQIKDAELFEVSVVSVPCNQTAMFSIAKSFDSQSEYDEWKAEFTNVKQAHVTDAAKVAEVDAPQAVGNTTQQERHMSTEKTTPDAELDLKAFAEEVAKSTAAKIAMQQAEQKAKELSEAEEKAAAEVAEVQEKEAEQEKVKTIVKAGMSGAEQLINDVEKRVAERHGDLESVVQELQKDLAEKKDEINAMRESKRQFSDRGNSDWKKAFESDIDDAWVMGLATGKGWNTKLGQNTMEKVNAHSGVAVSSADFEQTVSTNIERDIQLELVLAPLFREIQMTSATQILPIMPDAGYAEFTANQTASGSSPHGNLQERGDAVNHGSAGGVDMTERTLSTKKLISQSYLGNETEEDAILPILPLIRESIVRAHARGIENAILLGNHADGVYGTGGAAFEGLVTMAGANKTQSTTAFASESLTASMLLNARKAMGKWGMNPQDVLYIVNSKEYFNLLSDAEFQDVNLVGNMATKLSGEIGEVFGSKVIVCDEFATPATGKFFGIAVNPKNFVMPRLRGVTIESDYEVANQRRVLVASQRLGFTDLIDASTAAHALQYKAS